MANIYFYNASSVMVKWVAQDQQGNWNGNALDPGRNHIMSDTNIINAGFSLSGFTGFTFSPTPNISGYSGIFYAFDGPPSASQIKDAEKELAKK